MFGKCEGIVVFFSWKCRDLFEILKCPGTVEELSMKCSKIFEEVSKKSLGNVVELSGKC